MSICRFEDCKSHKKQIEIKGNPDICPYCKRKLWNIECKCCGCQKKKEEGK